MTPNLAKGESEHGRACAGCLMLMFYERWQEAERRLTELLKGQES